MNPILYRWKQVEQKTETNFCYSENGDGGITINSWVDNEDGTVWLSLPIEDIQELGKILEIERNGGVEFNSFMGITLREDDDEDDELLSNHFPLTRKQIVAIYEWNTRKDQ